MSGFSGADVDQVEALAHRLEQASNRLDAITARASLSLMTAAWTGADIDQVRSTWNGRTRPSLAAAARTLDGLSLDLKRQAQQQRATSAVGASTGGGFSGGGGGGGGGGSWGDSGSPVPDWLKDIIDGFDPDSDKSFGDQLVELIDKGVDIGGLILDSKELQKVIDAGIAMGDDVGKILIKTESLTDIIDGIKGFKLGSVLSIAGLGFDAIALGTAIGENDQPQILQSSLDLIAGGVSVAIPGVGLAWTAGQLIGTGLYEFGQTQYDTADSATRSALHDMYGPGVSADSLTQQQAAELVARYDGVGGFFNAQYDALAGMTKDMFGLY